MLILCEFTDSTWLHLHLHRRCFARCFATLRNKVGRRMWENAKSENTRAQPLRLCRVTSMDDASSSNTEKKLRSCLREYESKGRPSSSRSVYEISRHSSRERNKRYRISSLSGSLRNARKSTLRDKSEQPKAVPKCVGELERQYFVFLNRKLNSAPRPTTHRRVARYIGNKVAWLRAVSRNSRYLPVFLIKCIARWTAVRSQRTTSKNASFNMNMHKVLSERGKGKPRDAPFMARLPRLLQRFCFSVIIAFRMGDGGRDSA